MAVPGGRNGVEDDGEEVLFYEEVGEVEEDFYEDPPPHLLALSYAAQSGNVEALRVAIANHTGSIDDPVEDTDTALHLSCLYGHLSCVKLLLEKGASLECIDDDGAIPLHDACAGGYAEIVQLILNAGDPDLVKRMIDTVDVEGDTPLHHAARGEHLDVVNLLLSVGASPGKRNTDGKTPAEVASPGANVQSVLESAARAN